MKDGDMRNEENENERIGKEIEVLKNEQTKIKKQIQSSEHIAANQQDEISKLTRIIQEAEAEKLRQIRELESVVNERDALGTQLVSRNQELSKLYEKIKLQRGTLHCGEAQFNEQISEQRKLVNSLDIEKERLDDLKNDVKDLEELRREEIRLERDLLREQCKTKALSCELERPLNVHRWRKLANSEPKRFSAIQKLQRLQKRLIDKAEEGAEKDRLIKEQESLYVELKNILARQPGAEVAEQLETYEQNIKDKMKQLSRMQNELEIYRHQVEELREEMQDHNNQFSELREEYFQRMSGRDDDDDGDVVVHDGGEDREDDFEMPFMTTAGGGAKNGTIGL